MSFGKTKSKVAKSCLQLDTNDVKEKENSRETTKHEKEMYQHITSNCTHFSSSYFSLVAKFFKCSHNNLKSEYT